MMISTPMSFVFSKRLCMVRGNQNGYSMRKAEREEVEEREKR